MKIEKLFYTPFVQIQTDIDGQKFIEQIQHYYNNQIDWQRKWVYEGIHEGEMGRLYDIMYQTAHDIMKQCGHDIKMSAKDTWFNYWEPKGHMRFHDHFDTLLNQVFYPQVDDDTGELVIIDPRGGTSWSALNYTIGNEGNGNTSEFHGNSCTDIRIKPTPGLLIAFPGYLVHGTMSNLSTISRSSFAANWDRADIVDALKKANLFYADGDRIK